MFCKKCGCELDDDCMFCTKCGCKVTVYINADVDVNADISYNKEINTVVDTTINGSISNSAEVDVSSSNVKYTTVNNYNTTNHYERRGSGTGKAVAAALAVEKTHSAGKRLISIILIITLLISAASLYVTYFVSGPEETVNKMVDAVNQMDINTAVDCFCPRVVGEYKAMLGVGNVMLGIAGLPGDMNALSGIAPLLGAKYDAPKFSCTINEVRYTGGSFDAFPIKIDGIGKILASDAYVTITTDNGDSEGVDTIHLKNYGNDGWLIEDDLFGSSNS